MKNLKKVINLICALCFLWGSSSFILRIVIVDYAISKNKELPLSANLCILVDNQSNIYIGLPFFEAIQVYDKNGIFVNNWHVESHGGTFYLQSANKQLEVYVERDDHVIKYSYDGTLISKTPLNEIEDSIRNGQQGFRDTLGVNYWIDSHGIFPKIKKNDLVIINQNLFLKSITYPGSFIISFFSILLFCIINRKLIANFFKKYFNKN